VGITADLEGWDFQPVNIKVDGPRSDVIFTGNYRVYGYVKDSLGKGVKSARVTFSDGNGYVLTDEEGYWEKYLSGRIKIKIDTPEGWEFSPDEVIVDGPKGPVEFKGGYRISGYVKDTSGEPVEGVKIRVGSYGEVFTDEKGYWQKKGLSGVVEIVAEKEGWKFTPSSFKVKSPGEEVNFTGVYKVWGYVKDLDGRGIEGVKVTFSGGNGDVTTDEEGYWEKYVSGEVVVKVDMPEGWEFSPSQIVVDSPEGPVGFKGEYKVWGYVKDSSGNGVEGVTITFSRGYGSVVTDKNGYWEKKGLSGRVKITPQKMGWAFEPQSFEVDGPEKLHFNANNMPMIVTITLLLLGLAGVALFLVLSE